MTTYYASEFFGPDSKDYDDLLLFEFHANGIFTPQELMAQAFAKRWNASSFRMMDGNFLKVVKP